MERVVTLALGKLTLRQAQGDILIEWLQHPSTSSGCEVLFNNKKKKRT